jgi:beta-lactamase regulating signal transducer with metallopeptidase domain
LALIPPPGARTEKVDTSPVSVSVAEPGVISQVQYIPQTSQHVTQTLQPMQISPERFEMSTLAPSVMPVVAESTPEIPVRKTSWKNIAVSFWLVGVVCFGICWLGTHARAAIFMLRCQWEGKQLHTQPKASLRANFTLPTSSKVRVVYHENIPVPLVMGVFRSTIFFPPDAVNWPDEKVQAILLHELAHVARRDLFWQNLVHLVCILYWPLPTVWYLAHRIRTEQESACDDMVLQSGQRSSDYADVLLGLSKSLSIPARIPETGIPMLRRKTVMKRIDAVLDSETRRTPVSRWLGVSLLCSVMLLTALVSVFAPKIPFPTPVFSMSPTERQTDETQNNESQIVETFFESLRKKQFDLAAESFSRGVYARWSGSELQNLFERCERAVAMERGVTPRNQNRGGVGQLKSIDPARKITFPGGGVLWESVIRFENAAMGIRLALDATPKIIAFEIYPLPRTPAPQYCGWVCNSLEIRKRHGFDGTITSECFDAEGKPFDPQNNNGTMGRYSGFLFRKVEHLPSDSGWTDPNDGSHWVTVDTGNHGVAWNKNMLSFFALQQGTYRILLTGYNYKPEDQANGNVFSEPVTLDSSQKEKAISLQLNPGGILKMTMLDKETGEPVENAYMRFLSCTHIPQNVGYGWFIKFNGRQEYYNLVPGKYQFSVYCPDREVSDPVYEPVDHIYEADVSAGQTNEITVVKRKRSHTPQELDERWPYILTGTVRDTGGRPLEGAEVRIRRDNIFVSGGWPSTATITDNEGKFLLRYNPESLNTMQVLDPREAPTPENPDIMEIRIEAKKPGFVWKGVQDAGGTVHGRYFEDDGKVVNYANYVCVEPVPSHPNNIEYGYGDRKRRLNPEEMCHPLKPFNVNLVMEPAAIVEGMIVYDEELVNPGDPVTYSRYSPYPHLEPEGMNDRSGRYVISSGKAVDGQGRFQIDVPPNDRKYGIEVPVPENWIENHKFSTESFKESFVFSQPGTYRLVIRWNLQDGVIVRKAAIESR